jgi:hypothetical protein
MRNPQSTGLSGRSIHPENGKTIKLRYVYFNRMLMRTKDGEV